MRSWRLWGLNSSSRWEQNIAAESGFEGVATTNGHSVQREVKLQGKIILDAFSSQLSVLSRQVGDLQADNLKLYEKIRFLQVLAEATWKNVETNFLETS